MKSLRYKFRGKRIDNGEWVYGYYCYGARAYDGHIQHEILQTNVAGCYGREVDPETVSQYAGLKDGEGKALDWYDGDILEKENGCLAEIVFENGCFMGRWIGRQDLLFYFNQQKQRPEWFRKIGNRSLRKRGLI